MKKIALLALALILILSIAACNGNTDNAAGNNSTSPTASQNGNESDTGPSDSQGSENEPSPSDSQGDENSPSPSDSQDDENEPVSGDPQGNTNLISIGTTATSTFANRYGVKHSASMCVEEVIRGDAALTFINDTMMAEKSLWSAEAPKEEDQEYIVAKITYSLLAYDDGDARAASFCYAYSGTFEAYPSLLASMFYDKDNNYPRLSNTEVKVGETVTAYEIFQISKTDSSPAMTYGCTLADLSNGLWFKLY